MQTNWRGFHPQLEHSRAEYLVLMGEPGISLADPDSYALDVLGDILNFSS